MAAVVLLALGLGWIAWVGVGCGLVLALIYSAAYFDPVADHRLVKHGYPPGTAQRILSERDRAKDPDRMRRYMQTYRNNALEEPAAGPQEESCQVVRSRGIHRSCGSGRCGVAGVGDIGWA